MDLFVYGTLQSNGCNRGFLAGSQYVGLATTVPAYAIVNVGKYKGLVPGETAVAGEVWRVSTRNLHRLDELEAVDSGLYTRTFVRLQGYPDGTVQTYVHPGEDTSYK